VSTGPASRKNNLDQTKKFSKWCTKNNPYIGYIDADAVMIFDEESFDSPKSDPVIKWYEISRSDYRIDWRYKENNLVVGYVDSEGGVNKNLSVFKIRPPIQKLRNSKVRDLRSLEKGIVCDSIVKDKQRDLAVKLGLYTSRSVSDVRGGELCHRIREELFKRELQARKSGGKSERWIYLFNERKPIITLSRVGVGKKQVYASVEVILKQ